MAEQSIAQNTDDNSTVPFDKLSPAQQEKVIQDRIKKQREEMQKLIDRDLEREELKKADNDSQEKALKKASFEKRTANGRYYLLFGLSEGDINNLKNFDPDVEKKYKILKDFVFDEYGDYIVDFSEERKQEYIKHSIEFMKYFYGRYMLVYKSNNNLNDDPFGDKIINEMIEEYKAEVDQAWANKDVQAAIYGSQLMTDRRLRNKRLNGQIISKIEKYTKEMKLEHVSANKPISPGAAEDLKQTLSKETSWIDNLKYKVGILVLVILIFAGAWIFQGRKP